MNVVPYLTMKRVTLRKFKPLILAIAGIQIMELIYVILNDPQIELYRCYLDKTEYDSEHLIALEDVLLSDVQPSPDRTIFFHETNCHSPDKPNILNLTTRQACSIESAALNNPEFQVFVLFASPTFMPRELDPMIEALLSYSNVHFRQLNIWRYAKDTPIEDWLKKGSIFSSP